ncbi:hypothetical protein PPTG_04865 [Phytophthora nicotianae INRA-310]|uniref:Uncharacterized protein n=1 Tax=Phytophthora nicotianae (strain INRA-310) TaxID=761204 RepID=W2R2E1_PHYN3|nr:hypothetical protein PPTG_04865 [Phytophthora nicotianae INRA-310]ETN19617.1 hypothetical protein PPTG_04865 [Phytophthora nicotianae INRA-310]
MTKQSRSLTYSAEYEFGGDNILTAAYFEETRLRNQQRIKHAHSVIDTEAGGRTVNNAKKIQQALDREIEIAQHNQMLLERLERIHKKMPKRFDVSHHTLEHLSIHGPSNYPQWQREQERIAEENKKMKRRIDQTKSLFSTKQLAADAAKYLYFSEKLSKADRRLHLKQNASSSIFSPMLDEQTVITSIVHDIVTPKSKAFRTNSTVVASRTNYPESAQRLKENMLHLMKVSLR